MWVLWNWPQVLRLVKQALLPIEPSISLVIPALSLLSSFSLSSLEIHSVAQAGRALPEHPECREDSDEPTQAACLPLLSFILSTYPKTLVPWSQATGHTFLSFGLGILFVWGGLPRKSWLAQNSLHRPGCPWTYNYTLASVSKCQDHSHTSSWLAKWLLSKVPTICFDYLRWQSNSVLFKREGEKSFLLFLIIWLCAWEYRCLRRPEEEWILWIWSQK